MGLSRIPETCLIVGDPLTCSAIIIPPSPTYALYVANHVAISVLLARDETSDEQIRDSNLGLSSMLLYHATVIIHGR